MIQPRGIFAIAAYRPRRRLRNATLCLLGAALFLFWLYPSFDLIEYWRGPSPNFPPPPNIYHTPDPRERDPWYPDAP